MTPYSTNCQYVVTGGMQNVINVYDTTGRWYPRQEAVQQAGVRPQGDQELHRRRRRGFAIVAVPFNRV